MLQLRLGRQKFKAKENKNAFASPPYLALWPVCLVAWPLHYLPKATEVERGNACVSKQASKQALDGCHLIECTSLIRTVSFGHLLACVGTLCNVPASSQPVARPEAACFQSFLKLIDFLEILSSSGMMSECVVEGEEWLKDSFAGTWKQRRELIFWCCQIES